jgi:hypothetical protein
MYAIGDPAGMVFFEKCYVSLFRPDTEAIDCNRRPGIGNMNYHGGNPCKVDHVGLKHSETEPGSHPRINGIAAFIEYTHGRLSGQIVAGYHHLFSATNGWAI